MKSLRWSLVTLFFSSGLMALVKDSKTSLPALPNTEFLEALTALKSCLRALCESGSLVWSEEKSSGEIELCLEWVRGAKEKMRDLKKLIASDKPMIHFLGRLEKDLEELGAALQASRDVKGTWKKYFPIQPTGLNDVETKRRQCIERLGCNKLT